MCFCDGTGARLLRCDKASGRSSWRSCFPARHQIMMKEALIRKSPFCERPHFQKPRGGKPDSVMSRGVPFAGRRMHRTPGTAQDDEKVISWTGLRHVSNARVQELDTGRTFRIMTRTSSMNTLKTLTFAATTALAVATFTLPGAQAQTAKQMQEPQGGSGYGPDARRTGSGGAARCPDCRYPRRSEPDGRTGRPVSARSKTPIAPWPRVAGSACRTAPGNRDAAP